MSKKVYCTAQFLPKEGKEEELFETLKALEPDTLREEGCIQYVVTKHIYSPLATGKSFPIVFHEIWQDMQSFEAHSSNEKIQHFFNTHCIDPNGLAADFNVCVYSDE